MARNGYPFWVTLRRKYILPVAIRVANVPIKKSKGRVLAKVRLKIKQPILNPGMAAGVNRASTHNASEIRNWTTQVAEPGKSRFCRCQRRIQSGNQCAVGKKTGLFFHKNLLTIKNGRSPHP